MESVALPNEEEPVAKDEGKSEPSETEELNVKPEEDSLNPDDPPFSNSQLLLTNSPLGPTITSASATTLQVKQHMLRKYFAMRPGSFDHAVEDVKQYLKPEVDGKFGSAWLLAEIDHWDHEKERLVILTDLQMLVIKYNFVTMRIEDCRRIQLHMIDRIKGGRFQYPDKTMMMPREYQTGIRISWNKNEVLSAWQRFSPFFNNPSYVTFTLHKAANFLDVLPSHMVYENFKAALVDAVQKSGAVFELVMEAIYLEVYVGAMSVVHNGSDIGYSKDRGMLSF